jgi:hypothetical protein
MGFVLVTLAKRSFGGFDLRRCFGDRDLFADRAGDERQIDGQRGADLQFRRGALGLAGSRSLSP